MSIFAKLKGALIKTSSKISENIDNIFFKRKLDEQTLEELEDLLIISDIPLETSKEIILELKRLKFNKEVDPSEIKLTLADIITDILEKAQRPFDIKCGKLNVILVCGVNGNGKTTTIGKLAASFIQQGKKVGIAACDTFRAAAVEQLSVWAEKSGAILFKGEEGRDPASVAYKALDEAKLLNLDILFIDTAGRLHNYKNLMDELTKIVKVIEKFKDVSVYKSLLVLDASTGQNAVLQAEQFKNYAKIDGIIITKLDGSAKAGAVLGINKKLGMPIYFIGIGEKLEDLKPFDPPAFAKALVGI